MNIFLDNIIFWLQKSGGISVYWSELISRIKRDNENTTFINLDSHCNNIFWKEVPTGFSVIYKPLKYFGLSRFFKVDIHEKAKFIFHSSYYRVSSSKYAVNVTTVHDFTMDYFAKGMQQKIHYHLKRFAIKNSQGIICVSENTKKDLLKLHPWSVGKMITVIHNGVDDYFCPIDNICREDVMERFKLNINTRYLLFVGSRASYKNFDKVVEVVKKLDLNYQLLIVGTALSDKEKKMLDIDISNRYVSLENIDGNQLNEIYNISYCFLYLSNYEGFGLPVVEAMKAGCPVLVNNSSSLPEISGDAGVLLNNLECSTIIKEIEALSLPDYRNQLIKKGFENAKRFSWEENYKQHIDFYNKVLKA